MSTSRRDAGPTPDRASLAVSSEAADFGFADSERNDTPCILTGEGTFSATENNHSFERIISSESRVAVISLNGDPLMPTKASRARKWIQEGKAEPFRTKLNLFAVRLLYEPSGYDKQSIVIGIDPGSKFTGVAVVSKRAVLCGFNLELPDYIKNRMDKRRELRRNRRSRKCRRRQCRFLNRTKCKIAPSIRARKQLEIRVVKELAGTYPISSVAVEDVTFDHYTKRWGWFFSQIEVGKTWLVVELERIALVTLFKGWETSIRRKELGLKKNSKKDARVPEAHVNDAIALCSLVLGNIRLTPFHFDIIRRSKYFRRKLHYEQPSKGGIRRKYGGTTTPFVFRKGDLVKATQGNHTIRGWVSGYAETRNRISVSDFYWKRLGRFTANRTKLLERNTGLLLKSKEEIKL